MQDTVASGLARARPLGFFETQLGEYAQRRAVLVDAFEKLGLELCVAGGELLHFADEPPPVLISVPWVA